MLGKIILALLAVSATPAFAQQQSDPQIAIYRQLLDQANANLVAVASELQKAQARIKQLEDKYEKKK